MRVVLDTNILLSALISPSGPPDRILTAWLAREFDLVTCPTQIEELRRASRYAKLVRLLRPHRVGEVVNALRRIARPDPPRPDHDLADPDDTWLLALAGAAGADWLVTGDRRSGLRALRHHGRTRITTPVDFTAEILDRLTETRRKH